jgi:hypothetical protein
MFDCGSPAVLCRETLGGQFCEGDGIQAFATGSIRTTRRLRVKAGQFAFAEIDLSAEAGDITIGGPIENDRQWATLVDVTAGGNIFLKHHIHVLTLDPVGNGTVRMFAGGNVVVDGDIDARGHGRQGSGGVVNLQSNGNGNVSISKKIDVRGPKSGNSSEMGIFIGPACAVRVSGKLDSRVGQLTNSGTRIEYRETLDLSGGSLLSQPFDGFFGGGNFVSCRCVDSDDDGNCDGGCVHDPIGVNPAKVKPPLEITPVASEPCS